jgi:hypothetical protein
MKNALRYWLLAIPVVLALGWIAWAGLTPVSEEFREETHVIPKGTWARRSAGEKFDVLPSQINLILGVRDVLVLKNHDEVPQMFGPVLIMPGQTFRLPFSVVSKNEFACTAHVSGQLTVNVLPTPPWWELVQLRTAAIMNSGRWL